MRRLKKLGILLCSAAAAVSLGLTSYAGAQVPAKAKATGKITSSTFIANPFDAEGRPILNLPFLHITAQATGNAIQLGKYTIQFEHTVHFEMIENQLMAVSIGEYTATAANGDTLYGIYRNEQVFGGDDFVGDSLMLGGTGRFEGVAGYETTIGSMIRSPDGLHSFSYEHEGWMTSVGSAK